MSPKAESPPKKRKAGVLLLEDGSVWKGFGFGAVTTHLGECVFHTAHSGYQEILTDPSYQKQILVFSLVQLGNQGFHSDDYESERVWASGCVARDYSEAIVHWRKEKSLDQLLKENKRPGLYGIDTRRLILHLRKVGSLWGVISTESTNIKELSKKFQKKPSMEGLSLASDVTTKKAYVWNEGSKHITKIPVEAVESHLKKCIVIDFGVKKQILRYLKDVGFEEVLVVPSTTKADEIEKYKPDAILLSNGPGDPAAEKGAIDEVKKLIGRYPILGICLGHQILSLALGMKTYKLKFGHHGANHPVKYLKTNRVEITSQNHGFAVLNNSIPDELEVTHLNLNDNTVEGFAHKKLPVAGIQYHPESAPGPIDSTYVFTQLKEGRFL